MRDDCFLPIRGMIAFFLQQMIVFFLQKGLFSFLYCPQDRRVSSSSSLFLISHFPFCSSRYCAFMASICAFSFDISRSAKSLKALICSLISGVSFLMSNLSPSSSTVSGRCFSPSGEVLLVEDDALESVGYGGALAVSVELA